MIRIFGTMTDPSGSPVPGAIIELRAINSTSEVLLGSTVTIKCDQQGAYSFQLAIGTYDAYAQNDRCGDMDYLGTARVSDNSVDGDVHSILVDGGINITPPMLDSASAAAQRAESAAALTAADRVSTGKDAESAKADSAAAKTAKNISVAAADTATQKAASAATHDASAQDAATRAENAASAVVGSVLDGGECDLSTGAYPQPITVAGKKYSTIWYVAVAGSVSGVTFDVGDLLRYTTAKTGYYFKVDAKDDVYSVNGDKGAVIVTPQKIGAEVAGTAQSLVDQHAANPSAHSILGVAGLRDELNGKTGLVWSGQVPIFGQWLFPYHLRFMSYAQLWSAVNKLVANPGPINLASLGMHRFSVVVYVDAPSLLIYRHAYYISLNGGVAYPQTNSEYSVGVPHSFIGHTNSNQAQVKMQGVRTTENNGFPYWELVFPTGVNVQAAQDLQIQLRICVEKTWA